MAGSFLSISDAATDFTAQLPQLIENYKNGRADGLSLMFIVAWFVGDIASLAGMCAALQSKSIFAYARI